MNWLWPQSSNMRRGVGIAALLAYIGTIFAANWAVARFGTVPVGFGLMAPAAVYFVGLAFSFRDLVQNTLGRLVSLGAIPVGALLSAVVSPQFALASGAAFLCSELADFAVYTPLLRRGWIKALILANAAGLIVDSFLFLTLAFGSLSFFWGQCLGKAWMTLLAVAVLGPVRQWYAILPDTKAPLTSATAA